MKCFMYKDGNILPDGGDRFEGLKAKQDRTGDDMKSGHLYPPAGN